MALNIFEVSAKYLHFFLRIAEIITTKYKNFQLKSYFYFNFYFQSLNRNLILVHLNLPIDFVGYVYLEYLIKPAGHRREIENTSSQVIRGLGYLVQCSCNYFVCNVVTDPER